MNISEINLSSNVEALRKSKGIKYDSDSMYKERLQYLFTYECLKGIFDRLFAGILIIALSPILGLIAIAIMLDSPGTPLFSQERVGKDGRKFFIYKFRTMFKNNDDSKYKAFLMKYVKESAAGFLDENGQDIYELASDPRVTRVGRLLRKTNLDELPQLINVIKGEMSFIGPRPDITFTVNMYNVHQYKRLSVKPGISGLWQVCGQRKNITFHDMIKFDLYYIKKTSLILDTKILFLTARTILKGHGS
jgi:lipopolysaccharide/colanic/teichoic acid biosynthesis glycosyltransferase